MKNDAIFVRMRSGDLAELLCCYEKDHATLKINK